MDQRDLIKLVGENLGDKLWHLADDAIDTVKTIIKRDKIDCFLSSRRSKSRKFKF